MIYVNPDNTTREATAEEEAEAIALFDAASSCRAMPHVDDKAGWEALRALPLPVRNEMCSAWIEFDGMILNGQGAAVKAACETIALPAAIEPYRQTVIDRIYIPS